MQPGPGEEPYAGSSIFSSFSRAYKTYSFCNPFPPQKPTNKKAIKWWFCWNNFGKRVHRSWNHHSPPPCAYVLYARDNDEKNGRPLSKRVECWYLAVKYLQNACKNTCNFLLQNQHKVNGRLFIWHIHFLMYTGGIPQRLDTDRNPSTGAFSSYTML